MMLLQKRAVIKFLCVSITALISFSTMAMDNSKHPRLTLKKITPDVSTVTKKSNKKSENKENHKSLQNLRMQELQNKYDAIDEFKLTEFTKNSTPVKSIAEKFNNVQSITKTAVPHTYITPIKKIQLTRVYGTPIINNTPMKEKVWRAPIGAAITLMHGMKNDNIDIVKAVLQREELDKHPMGYILNNVSEAHSAVSPFKSQKQWNDFEMPMCAVVNGSPLSKKELKNIAIKLASDDKVVKRLSRLTDK